MEIHTVYFQFHYHINREKSISELIIHEVKTQSCLWSTQDNRKVEKLQAYDPTYLVIDFIFLIMSLSHVSVTLSLIWKMDIAPILNWPLQWDRRKGCLPPVSYDIASYELTPKNGVLLLEEEDLWLVSSRSEGMPLSLVTFVRKWLESLIGFVVNNHLLIKMSDSVKSLWYLRRM